MALALPVRAAAPWSLPLFTSDPRTVVAAASRYAAPEGSNGVTLDYSVHAQIDESGRIHQTTRTVARVLRVQGIESERRLAVSWVPWRENRPKIKIRVIPSDGKPQVLDDSMMAESASPDDNGLKTLSAFLSDAEVDSIVEVEIDKSDRESAYPGARLGEIVLDSKFPTLNFRAVLDTPVGRPLHVETRSFPDVRRTAKPGGQQVVLEASNILLARSAAFLPPEVTPLPTITFSNVSNWQALAQWYANLFTKPLTSPSASHTVALTDQESAIEGAFEEIRKHVRDNSADLGAVPYTPHSPAETLAKGTADSKDEALLLISKLNDLGVPAKPALVSPAPQPDLIPGVPGIEAFRRVLVYVPGQHPLWIDPGAEFTPVSRLPTADQGRWALIADPATTALVRTPESTAADNRQIQTMEIQVRDGRDSIVTSTIEAFGAFEDALRPALREFADAVKNDQENLRVRFARFARTERITNVDVGQPNQLLKPCRIQLTGEGYTASYIGDQIGFVDLPAPAALELHWIATLFHTQDSEQLGAFDSAQRKDDYYFPPAFTEDERYRVLPPHGYRLKPLDPLPKITIGPLTVTTSVKPETDGSISVTYSFINPKSRYTVREVDAMRSDSAKLSGKAVRIALANIGEEKLASGELKEGVALLRETAAAEPSNINATLRLASAYVDAGAGAEAVKICRDVLSKNKDNAAAYARLGWVYGHDEFGRALRPGMNMAEAEKAYLKAIELDPAQPSYLLQLATLYSYGPAGIRYGASARLEEALQLYRRLGLDALARAGALNDYAAALLFAKKYDEIRQFFLYPQAESAERAIKLAAIAATASINDVQEEANFLFPIANNRRIQLIEAARYLLNSRDYGPAAMLFQAAGAAVQASLGIDLERLRRTRIMDESVISKQPAVAALQHFIVATLNPTDSGNWTQLVVPEARDVPVDKYRLALLQILPTTQALVQQPLAWPWVADLLATSTNFAADGNDKAGYRIQMPSPQAKGKQETVAYVVKRDGQYLILGLNGSAQFSGEALAKAASRDLASAHLWLDWANEEVGSAKTSDPMSTVALTLLWPPKSDDPAAVAAAAAALAARGSRYAEGLKVLKDTRQLNDPGLRTALDQAIAQAFLAHKQYGDALPVLQRLAATWPHSETVRYLIAQSLIYTNQFSEAAALIDEMSRTQPASLAPMRLRANMLAQQGKFKEASGVQEQICATPKPFGADWNSLAWLSLFTGEETRIGLQAAEKANEMTQSRNPEVQHTLALVQASNGDLKDARATAYHLMDGVGDSDELFTVFGRIAEQLDLREVAASYYQQVKKHDSESTVSLYSFAQMHLKNLLKPARPAAAVPPPDR